MELSQGAVAFVANGSLALPSRQIQCIFEHCPIPSELCQASQKTNVPPQPSSFSRNLNPRKGSDNVSGGATCQRAKHLNDQAKMEKTLSHVAPFCKRNFGKASSGSLKSAKCWLIAGRFTGQGDTLDRLCSIMTVWHTIDPQSQS